MYMYVCKQFFKKVLENNLFVYWEMPVPLLKQWTLLIVTLFDTETERTKIKTIFI